jgi:seryl-tRNA synthetase
MGTTKSNVKGMKNELKTLTNDCEKYNLKLKQILLTRQPLIDAIIETTELESKNADFKILVEKQENVLSQLELQHKRYSDLIKVIERSKTHYEGLSKEVRSAIHVAKQSKKTRYLCIHAYMNMYVYICLM